MSCPCHTCLLLIDPACVFDCLLIKACTWIRTTHVSLTPLQKLKTKDDAVATIGYDQGWAVFQIHVFEIQNTILYFVFKYLLKKSNVFCI